MSMQQFTENFGEIVTALGGVQFLRKFIIDLAVRGKLTCREANDTPVKDTIESILQKHQVKDENKFIIEKHEKPFPIPEHWEWVRLGDITEFSAGKTPSRREPKYWDNSQFPWVTISDMVDGGFIKTTKESISSIAYNEVFKQKIVSRGTMLMSVKLSIGKLSILDIDAFHNEAIIAIYPYLDGCKGYLFKCLNGFDIQKEASGAIKGSTLNQKTIRNIVIAFPPIEEQERIVAKVEKLIALCDQLEAQQNYANQVLLKALDGSLSTLSIAKSLQDIIIAWSRVDSNFSIFFSTPDSIKLLRTLIYDIAVTGRLLSTIKDATPIEKTIIDIQQTRYNLIRQNPSKRSQRLTPVSKDEEPINLPSRWTWIRLEEVCKVIEYGTSQKGHDEPVGIPVLRMGNIVDGKIDLEHLKYVDPDIKDLPRLFLKKGDLIFNRTNSYELVGKMGLFNEEDDAYTLASYLIRISIFDQYVLPEWINLFFQSSICRKTQIEPQITAQTNQANFSGSKLANVIIPLAPIEEQREIINRVGNYLKFCTNLETILRDREEVQNKFALAVIQSALDSDLKLSTLIQDTNHVTFTKQLICEIKLVSSMIKDTSITTLARILQANGGNMYAKELWKTSKLDKIDDFYALLKKEIDDGYIQEPDIAEIRLREVNE